jgi:RNA polymerase sigma-70 factor (family 1)
LRTDTCDTDKELFTRIAEGDEAAFIRLFHLYVPQIKPVITTITRSALAVPDLVQDIFLRIWLNREKLTEVKAPRSWIFSVVYYQCFNYLRKQSVRNKVEPGIFPINDAPTQWQESPESLLQFNETRSFIKQAIDGLPPQAKKIYLLSREQGLRIDEIATRLGLAPKTVKNTLTRASTSIRQFLQQKGVYLPLILLVIEINKFQ